MATSKRQAYDTGLQLLGQVGIRDKALAYPDELSGGQKQRAAIARTLAMHPKIVLFDEPTSALDPTMVSEVLGVIRQLAQQQLTMLIVTHEMRFARDVSSRVFYMDEGVIYEDGSPQQIFMTPQKPKTRDFIFKIKSWEYTISNSDFDFYGMNGSIENFCKRQMLAAPQIYKILLVVEEMLLNILMPQAAENFKICIKLTCAEEGEAELVFSYVNIADNKILDLAAAEDNLSALLVRKTAAKLDYGKTDLPYVKIIIV